MGANPVARFTSQAQSVTKPVVGLAAQGGGTHGAVTHGMLDVLLNHFEQRGISVGVLAGDSAGGKNALFTAYGLIIGEPGHKAEAASFMRERLWWSVDRMAFMARKGVSFQGLFDPSRAMAELVTHAGDFFNMPRDAMLVAEMSRRHPPLNLTNMKVPPLQQMAEQYIDFKRFMDPGAPLVILNTTDKHNGMPKIYLNSALTPQVAAESGYLPRVALQVFGPDHPSLKTHDHDGGFTANPAVWPLYKYCLEMTDLIVLRVTPLVRNKTALKGLSPDEAYADQELRYLYNAACEAELRGIKEHAELSGRRLNIHVVSVGEDWPHPISTQGSLKHTNWNFFTELRQAGAECATRWLANEGKQLGISSSYHADYEVFGHGPKPAAQPVPQLPGAKL